jgi:hypothetical protein
MATLLISLEWCNIEPAEGVFPKQQSREFGGLDATES